MGSLLANATLIFAGAAALILLIFLIRRPALGSATKVWLFFGIGVLPAAAAFTGNVDGFQQTTKRDFCAGCHTMDAYANDAKDPKSTTLASMHSRNEQTGEESCYYCHKDYGMYGTVATKMTGMVHMYHYYFGDPKKKPKLYKPFTNVACTHCHSMTLAGFSDESEHQAVMEDIKKGEVTCITDGCHGPAHGEISAEKKP